MGSSNSIPDGRFPCHVYVDVDAVSMSMVITVAAAAAAAVHPTAISDSSTIPIQNQGESK